MPTKAELRRLLSDNGVTAPADATKSELEALVQKAVPADPVTQPGSKRDLARKVIDAGLNEGLSFSNLVGNKTAAELQALLDLDTEDEEDE